MWSHELYKRARGKRYNHHNMENDIVEDGDNQHHAGGEHTSNKTSNFPDPCNRRHLATEERLDVSLLGGEQ